MRDASAIPSAPRSFRIPSLDAAAAAAARARQASLIKPRGSLGRLEELVESLAAMKGGDPSTVWPPAILVFAADHGVATRGVSAYPPEVTAQMVATYASGRAAVNVLARRVGASLAIVDVGVAAATAPPSGPHRVEVDRVRAGTRDFTRQPALSVREVERALEVGVRAARRLVEEGAGSLAVGDMGIGNTTAASAVVAAFLGCGAASVTGRGSGVDEPARRRKVELIDAALRRHRPDAGDPVDVLAKVGGLEIAAMTGALLAAAERRTPIFLDGFICGAAALAAVAMTPGVERFFIAAHRSGEPGHAAVLERLGRQPLLDLGLRLGEASGAALALPLVRAALDLHAEMATFEEAGVAEEAGVSTDVAVPADVDVVEGVDVVTEMDVPAETGVAEDADVQEEGGTGKAADAFDEGG